jgi:hypothetical protein
MHIVEGPSINKRYKASTTVDGFYEKNIGQSIYQSRQDSGKIGRWAEISKTGRGGPCI